METKAEYVTDSFVVDKLLMRDMVERLKVAGENTSELMDWRGGDGRYTQRTRLEIDELRATLTQIYDRWPELAN